MVVTLGIAIPPYHHYHLIRAGTPIDRCPYKPRLVANAARYGQRRSANLQLAVTATSRVSRYNGTIDSALHVVSDS